MAETTAPPPAAPTPKPAAPAAKTTATKTAAATKTAPAAAPTPVAPQGVTRREFLYYVWGASMALFLAETAGISVLFALPRFKEGQFGGKIAVSVTDFPKVSDAPVANNLGKFWMVTTDKGAHRQLQGMHAPGLHLCVGWTGQSLRLPVPRVAVPEGRHVYRRPCPAQPGHVCA